MGGRRTLSVTCQGPHGFFPTLFLEICLFSTLHLLQPFPPLCVLIFLFTCSLPETIGKGPAASETPFEIFRLGSGSRLTVPGPMNCGQGAQVIHPANTAAKGPSFCGRGMDWADIPKASYIQQEGFP